MAAKIHGDAGERTLAEKHSREQKQRLESTGDLYYRKKVTINFNQRLKNKLLHSRIKLFLIVVVPVIIILIYYLIAVIKGP